MRTLLVQMDRHISAGTHGAHTLHPKNLGGPPTSLAQLGLWAETVAPSELMWQTTMKGLLHVCEAIQDHFFHNFFWDLDHLCAYWLWLDDPHQVVLLAQKVVQLQKDFGKYSPIHFQYSHDFLYGYDWCRWVKKQPQTRALVHPYSIEFLNYLHKRHKELLELIALGDTKYGPLAQDAYRNPFSFKRTPTDERTLHEALSQQGCIPWPAWQRTVLSEDRWYSSQDFAHMRTKMAQELGMLQDQK